MIALIVVHSVIAVAFIVVSVFLIRALIQIRPTAGEAEKLLIQLNQDAALVGKIASNVAGFAQSLSSPWLKVGSIVSGIASAFFMRHRKSRDEKQV